MGEAVVLSRLLVVVAVCLCVQGEINEAVEPGSTTASSFSPVKDSYLPGRSKQMCEQYSTALSQDEVHSPSSASKRNASTCAIEDDLDDKRQPSKPREFPHMAAIGYVESNSTAIKYLCNGILISERFILTGAVCVSESPFMGKPQWALLGATDYSNHTEVDSNSILMEIIDWFTHPDYNHKTAFYNDIGLLKLKTDVVFNAHVRPACLNAQALSFVGESVIGSAWSGGSHLNDEENTQHLMKIGLRVVANSICQKFYEKRTTRLPRGFDETSLICSADPNGTDNIPYVCNGDSGSPLQVPLKSPHCTYIIIGLSSFGVPVCGLADTLTAYTRVSYFVPWIESIVWPTTV